jgi:hypothetical protein
MTLPNDTARCEGRQQRQFGRPTLCEECTDCLRRTDRPADVSSTPFTEPPPIAWHGGCPMCLSPDRMEIDA